MIKKILLKILRRIDRLCSMFPQLGMFRPLRGSFSALARLEHGILPGAVLVRQQASGRCPPGSMTERAGMAQHDHQPWPVFWVRADDARLVGKMLHWRDVDDRLCSEGVFQLHERKRLGEDRLLAQILVAKPTPLAGAWTSLASNWSAGDNYYHWLLDSLTRLKVRELLPEPTRILLPRSSRGFIGETLEMLGLSEQVDYIPTSCVQPERYYFCAPLAMTGVWNPLGYNWLRENFASYCQPCATGQAIFLTRRGGTRVPPNLAEIEALFTKHGFAVVDCGAISVKQQLHHASMAPAIAGLHGAAMTNLLWAKPGTPALEIFSPGYLNACYEQIAVHGRLQYHYEILTGSSSLAALTEWCRQFAPHD